MNNIDMVPDISWTWYDQKCQEILSGERWPKIYDDMYAAKCKWYDDRTLFLTIGAGILSRLACCVCELNVFLVFMLYFLTLIGYHQDEVFSRWPSHGYIWDLLAYWRGTCDKFAFYGGRIADVLVLYFNHFTLFYLSFILADSYLGPSV